MYNITVCPQRGQVVRIERRRRLTGAHEANIEIEMGRKQTLVVKQRLSKKEAPAYYENDISAESQAKEERTRFQKEDEHEKRPQCIEKKADKGKKETHSITSCGKKASRMTSCFPTDTKDRETCLFVSFRDLGAVEKQHAKT
jgi:hypothetical protein